MIIITGTETGLSIVVKEKTKKSLEATDAIKAADDYLALTDGRFGNVEWEYVGCVRDTDTQMIVYYRSKPQEEPE